MENVTEARLPRRTTARAGHGRIKRRLQIDGLPAIRNATVLASRTLASRTHIEIIRHPSSDMVLDKSSVAELLRMTPLVAIGRLQCTPSHPLFSYVGPVQCPFVGFMRSSVRRTVWHRNRSASEIQTPNVAGFFSPDCHYEREAIDAAGDDSDWIAVAPSLWTELCECLPTEVFTQTDGTSLRPFGPVSTALYVTQRRFFEAAANHLELDNVEIEERAIAIVRSALKTASSYWSRRGQRKHFRPSCERRRREIVEDVKEQIALNFRSNLSLKTLATFANSTPAQIARIFPLQTGLTIHDYQQSVRMRVSLDMLRNGRQSLNAAALELGYSSHSHFSYVFRRWFGVPPSNFARSRWQVE
jgi:AraC-like DNA-binding protein